MQAATRLPQHLRIDSGSVTEVKGEELTPYVYQALKYYYAQEYEEYGESLLDIGTGVDISISEHNLLLINEDYLFAFVFGAEWFCTSEVLQEVYLIRVGNGPTKLSEVFTNIKALARVAGVREIQLCPRGNPALVRLYRRYGAEDVMTTMRIT